MREENKLALVVAYYLSKFDEKAYMRLDLGNMGDTHKAIGKTLDVKHNTVKNMRDEFDSIHDNPRQGWYQRELSISRKAVVDQYGGLSESELYAVVIGVLNPGLYNQVIFNEAEQEEIPKVDKVEIEGETVERKVLSYKRNRKSTGDCKKRDNYSCQSCGFWHEDRIVECHHLKPISMTKESVVDMNNLITLCPTCHRIAHSLIRKNYEKYTNKDTLLPSLALIIKGVQAKI